MKIENTPENNWVRALKGSRVVLVCQHLFNCQRKNNNNLYKCTLEHYLRRRFTYVSSPDFFRGRGDVCTQAITSFATGSLVTWPTRTTAAMRCLPILTFVPVARASLIESVRTTSSTRRKESLCSCPSLWSTSLALVTAGTPRGPQTYCTMSSTARRRSPSASPPTPRINILRAQEDHRWKNREHYFPHRPSNISVGRKIWRLSLYLQLGRINRVISRPAFLSLSRWLSSLSGLQYRIDWSYSYKIVLWEQHFRFVRNDHSSFKNRVLDWGSQFVTINVFKARKPRAGHRNFLNT